MEKKSFSYDFIDPFMLLYELLPLLNKNEVLSFSRTNKFFNMETKDILKEIKKREHQDIIDYWKKGKQTIIDSNLQLVRIRNTMRTAYLARVRIKVNKLRRII